jgi:hypothetical protein
MQFLFLSEANLQDRLFLRDLFKHFPKLAPPFIILHDTYMQDENSIRMLTKRVSAHLSESMVPNIAFSGEQRGLLSRNADGQLIIKTDTLYKAMQNLSGIVINTLVQSGTGTSSISAEELLKAFRQQVDIERMLFFPQNPQSPLGGMRTPIASDTDHDQALQAFEEERHIIRLAHHVKPALIVSAHNFYL